MPVVQVLRPERGVAEAEQRRDGPNGCRTHPSPEISDQDLGRIARHQVRDKEVDRDRHNGGEQIEAKPAERVPHAWPLSACPLATTSCARAAQPSVASTYLAVTQSGLVIALPTTTHQAPASRASRA